MCSGVRKWELIPGFVPIRASLPSYLIAAGVHADPTCPLARGMTYLGMSSIMDPRILSKAESQRTTSTNPSKPVSEVAIFAISRSVATAKLVQSVKLRRA